MERKIRLRACIFYVLFWFLGWGKWKRTQTEKNRLPFLVWTIRFDSMRTHNIIWLFDLRHRKQRCRRRKKTPRIFEFRWKKKREIITISPKGTQMKNMNCCDVARTLFVLFLPYKSKILNRIKIIIRLMHTHIQIQRKGGERENGSVAE